MEKNREFEKNSLILFALMMGANIFNYIFQIILGKLLTVEDYGILNTLMSMVTILSIPNLLFVMVTARYTATYSIHKENRKIKALLQFGFKAALIVSGVLLVVGIIGADFLSDIFGIKESSYFIMITFVVGITLIASIAIGVLQGGKKFFNYGVQNLINVGCKLVFSVILVYLGLGLHGVLIALVIGIIIACIYSYRHAMSFIGKIDKKVKITLPYKEIMGYSLGTFVAQICITILTNGDILLVKMFFSEREAGIYSSAMVLGKIAMYIAGAVVAALFPMVAEVYVKGKNTKGLFIKALIYGGGSASICSFGLVVFGELVIKILFGTRYQMALRYLPYVCLFIVPLTFLTVVMNFVLAIGDTKFFSITTMSGCLVLVLIIIKTHTSIESMLIVVGIILTIVTLINIWNAFSKCKKQTND